MEYIVVTNTWTVISNTANIGFQVVGSAPVEVGANVLAPAAGFVYPSMAGDRGVVSELFPNANSNNVWARASQNSAIVVS